MSAVDLHRVNGVTVLEVAPDTELATLRRHIAALIRVNDQYGDLCDVLISHNGSLIERNAFYRGRALLFGAVGLASGALVVGIASYGIARALNDLLNALGWLA